MKISEDQLQAQCVKWFKMQYPDKIIFAIPNGGSRNKIEAAKLKRCGVLAGVPDLCIPEPTIPLHWFGLYIELKTGKNKPTFSQNNILTALDVRQYAVSVCYTFEEFVNVVREYFNES